MSDEVAGKVGEVQERLGAVWGEERGRRVASRYGGGEEEYGALRGGVGVAVREVGGVEMTGADRLRFLNAYVTCEVKGLAPGEVRYGFFTSAQGRILADVTVLALEDRLWLEVPAGEEERIVGHLRKFVIADRVEMRKMEAVMLALVGPRAGQVLGEGVEKLEEGRQVAARVMEREARVVRGGRFGEPGYVLWTAEAGALLEALVAGGAARPVGAEALAALRVEAGVPRFGREFGPENFPQETGEAGAVSYTKGCYLGQEVVARIHYRGGVQKGLCGLVFPAGAPPGAGVALLHEGREAGRLGTVATSPALGLAAGLAILHRRAAEPGTRVEAVVREQEGDEPRGEIKQSWAAEVRPLPLVQPGASTHAGDA